MDAEALINDANNLLQNPWDENAVRALLDRLDAVKDNIKRATEPLQEDLEQANRVRLYHIPCCYLALTHLYSLNRIYRSCKALQKAMRISIFCFLLSKQSQVTRILLKNFQMSRSSLWP